jgi:hypothetical protein
VFVQSEFEAVPVVSLTHESEPLTHRFGVTMRTTGTDFGASRQGIPRRIGPFNRSAGHN